MTWSASDAHRFKKDLGPKAARRWAAVANRVLQETGSESKAIRTASGVTRGSISRRMRLKKQGR